ncbi:hypothetical protein G6F23_014132 [Rhizopus arrhizus]|nr:hypothetical protein G6F23_014132 [Rhizopus arrhizus]
MTSKKRKKAKHLKGFVGHCTSSNFRDIFGATLYSTLAATEESPHEVSPRLGSSALVVQRQHPGTTMVAQEPQTMAWSIPSSFNSRAYTLCRWQQHRLGMLLCSG